MAQVVEIKNPRALLAPEVDKVLHDAFGSVSLATPNGFTGQVAADLYKWVSNDMFFLLIGFEEGAAKSLVLGFFPSDSIFPYPTITMFYSKGSKELLHATGEKLMDILLSRWSTAAWTVNSSGRSNAAWQRLFRIPGKTKIDVLGSVMQISQA